MPIHEWWPRLRTETREWLVANNGDVVPEAIAQEIRVAGGALAPGCQGSASGDGETPGAHLSDAETDWIEAVANGESPKSQ